MTRELDGYIRVSRVAGREGDSFLSPAQQRARIMQWADQQDVEIVRWWEELDQTGGRMERPMLQAVLDRCRRGETGGIVVAKRDRFARNLLEALKVIKELEQIGATFAAADGLDSATPEGRLGVNVMLSLADFELQRISESWRHALTSAHARGVYVACRPPAGYDWDEDKRLVVNETVAPIVREVFLRKAAGESSRSITRWARSEGLDITRSGVQHLLKNRAYLGEQKIRDPETGEPIVKRNAHDPLVTDAEWEGAMAAAGTYRARDGSIAANTPLAGIVRCGTCGKRLRGAQYGVRRGGKRFQYSCTNPDCTGHASMTARRLDDYVEGELMQAIANHEPHVLAVLEGDDRYQIAMEAVDKARAEMEAFRDDPRIIGVVGMDGFVKGLEARQSALDLARRELRDMPPPEPQTAPTVTFEEWARNDLRRTFRQFVAEVTIRYVGRVGSTPPPVWERATIRWVGQSAE